MEIMVQLNLDNANSKELGRCGEPCVGALIVRDTSVLFYIASIIIRRSYVSAADAFS